MQDGQRVRQAYTKLSSLGVTNIGVDRLRQVGRGVRDQQQDSSQLCGRCARGKVTITSSGDVWPCVFARWMCVGNVHESTLAEISTGSATMEVYNKLKRMPTSKKDDGKCSPESKCHPAEDDCGPHCPPGYHSGPKKCWPCYYLDDE